MVLASAQSDASSREHTDEPHANGLEEVHNGVNVEEGIVRLSITDGQHRHIIIKQSMKANSLGRLHIIRARKGDIGWVFTNLDTKSLVYLSQLATIVLTESKHGMSRANTSLPVVSPLRSLLTNNINGRVSWIS
jgi:hypothetical protein